MKHSSVKFMLKQKLYDEDETKLNEHKVSVEYFNIVLKEKNDNIGCWFLCKSTNNPIERTFNPNAEKITLSVIKHGSDLEKIGEINDLADEKFNKIVENNINDYLKKQP